jgi:TolB-like protein/class 3 adenylate cyclase/Tfp pilus assembly protein PilF
MNQMRKIAAILVADVVGFSRLVETDEERTLARLRALRSDLIDPTIAVHHGRVVKRTGDGAIVEFRSVVDAVRCAIEVQSNLVERNAGLPPERRIEFRVGIHLGDIVEESDGDLMGDGVNIAARLEGICEVGGICISEDAYRQVRDRIEEPFVDLGEQILKNITRPVRAYQLMSSGNGTKTEPIAAEAQLGQALPIKPSLAVLPFQNMSGDTEQEYFADGVVEDIITALSRFRSFGVIARNSSFVYKGRAVDVREAAKELGVRYVLEGSIRRAGNRLRITAQLIDGVTGAHLWAQNFDGALEDVFDFQDRITETVAIVVEPQIQRAEIERSRRERPGSVAAHDLDLRALSTIWTDSAEDNAEAYVELTEALARDPDNAMLLAHAASALEQRIALGWPPLGPDDRQKCGELARRGLQHAAGDAMVMAYCGMSLLQGARDYDWGMATLESAAKANPNNLLVVVRAGVGHLHCGDIDQALAYFHRAKRLSPGDPGAHQALTGIAHAQMVLGNYAEALDWATRSLALNTNYDPTLWIVIAANAHLGRMKEAHHFLQQLKRIAPVVTVERIRAGQPAKDPSRVAAILDGLRLAGLEEG